MTSKKFGVLVLALFSLILLASFISADLEIKKTTVSSMAIPELNLPAIFTVELTNRGVDDTFSIYSLAGARIEPNGTIRISAGASQTITLKAYPTIPLKISPDYYSFEYKIKGASSGLQSDQLAISMVELKDAFNFNVDDIDLNSKTAVVYLENKCGHSFENLKLEISSTLFTATLDFPVEAYENKIIEVPLDTNKLKEILAGKYVIDAKIISSDVTSAFVSSVRYNEQPEITTTESSKGFFIQQYKIEKKNDGNTKTDVSIVIKKNMFTALFTSFDIVPTKKQISGLKITYIFEKELLPNGSISLTSITNWWILFAVIVAAILAWYIIEKYVKEKIVLRKYVSFVRTKGGEFALKITIKARARDFVEKIRIIDRLPPMVKIFERPGLSAPDKIDTQNRRLEWNIAALGRGEEREWSYIVYSKIGMIGKFELPSADAIYEFNGKIKDAQSNRAFFVHEPRSA